MKNLEIIKVSHLNIEKLRDISIRTFSQTYEQLNTPENFKKYIEEHFSTSQITSDIENKNSSSYLIYRNNQVVGYIKINVGEAQTEKMNGNGMELERIYVLKKYHGQNIGHALLQFAIAESINLEKDFIWLGVWEKNERATRFYEKNGFVKFDTHIFKLGNDEQNDYLFKLYLK